MNLPTFLNGPVPGVSFNIRRPVRFFALAFKHDKIHSRAWRTLEVPTPAGSSLPAFRRFPHLFGVTPSMTCDQEEGLHAVQRSEHRMRGAAREQVRALLRGELEGFVASGIEVPESFGDAAMLP